MIRRALVAVVAIAVLAATAWILLRPSMLRAEPVHSGEDGPDQTVLACRATGRVILPRKLACPDEAIEVRFSIDPICGDGTDRGAIQHIMLRHELPSGIVLMTSADHTQAGPGGPNQWSMELSNKVDAHIEAGHSVRALQPGVYELGGATVEITDREGKVWASTLTPTTLVVSPCGSLPDRKPVALYLPLAMSPGCAPMTRPTDLVLLVDRSASMGGGALTGAVGRASRFLDELDLSADRVAVLGFDSRVEVLTPLTHNAAAVEAALAGLAPRSGTRIDLALRAGIALFDDPRAGDARRRALIVLTDGVQIGPGGDAAVLEAAKEARRMLVTVIAIGVGPAPNWSLLRAIADNPPEVGVGPSGSRLDDALHDAVAAVRCAR